MRKDIRRFVQLANETLPLQDVIYEFGALQVAGQPEVEDLRSLFPGRPYVGCDMRPGPGVDKILNLHNLDLEESSVGSVICMDTLEHVEYPREAVREIFRILGDDGIAVLSSVMNFPIHGYPQDFWRFTPEGFRSLLNCFDDCFVGYYGHDDFPHTVVGLGFKGQQPPELSDFRQRYEQWRHRNNLILEKLTGERIRKGNTAESQ